MLRQRLVRATRCIWQRQPLAAAKLTAHSTLSTRSISGSALRLEKKVLDDDTLEKAGVDKKWSSNAQAPRVESAQVKKRTRRAWVSTLLLLSGAAAFLARPLSDEEKEQFPEVEKNGWELSGAVDRVYARYFSTIDSFAAPVFEKLLPDALPPPYDRPTLVIAVDDLLVKSEWTRAHGWRVAKRPGVDYFLGYLAQYYEIVLFSDKYQAMAAETVLKLDPLRASVSYALFREATRYENGVLIKDLRNLNRDLGRVIVLDVDPLAMKLQPDNCLLLPRWHGNADDKDLIRLIPMLEWIGARPITDVRPTLKEYSASPDGALNEFERRDAQSRQEWIAKHSNKHKSLNSLLGIQSASMPPQDAIRLESQRNYERFRKHVEEYGKKLIEEEEQKIKDAMNQHEMTLNKWLQGDTPNPEEISAAVKN